MLSRQTCTVFERDISSTAVYALIFFSMVLHQILGKIEWDGGEHDGWASDELILTSSLRASQKFRHGVRGRFNDRNYASVARETTLEIEIDIFSCEHSFYKFVVFGVSAVFKVALEDVVIWLVSHCLY